MQLCLEEAVTFIGGNESRKQQEVNTGSMIFN